METSTQRILTSLDTGDAISSNIIRSHVTGHAHRRRARRLAVDRSGSAFQASCRARGRAAGDQQEHRDPVELPALHPARLQAAVLRTTALVALGLCCAPAVGAQQDPELVRARKHHAQARALEAAGQHAQALAQLWEAAQLAPADAEIQNHLGLLLERAGSLDGAVIAYERAAAARPRFHESHRNLVLALTRKGEGERALEQARRFLEADPKNPEVIVTLGLAELELGRVGAAILALSRALERAPDHAVARYNLALALRAADRLDEAAFELRRLLEREPRPEAHYTLGSILWQRGELREAEAELRAAVAGEPAYGLAHHALGALLLARRDLRGADAALRKAVRLRPELPEAHSALAQVLRQSGDEQAAKAHLAESARLRERAQDEQAARFHTNSGLRRFEAGDFEAALELFRRATQLFADYAPAHYQMGRTLERLGRPDDARRALARAHALDPNLAPPGAR